MKKVILMAPIIFFLVIFGGLVITMIIQFFGNHYETYARKELNSKTGKYSVFCNIVDKYDNGIDLIGPGSTIYAEEKDSLTNQQADSLVKVLQTKITYLLTRTDSLHKEAYGDLSARKN